MNEFPFLNHGSSSDNFVQIGINYHSDEVSVRASPHIIELLWNSNNVSFFEAHVFNLLHKNTYELIFWDVPDARQLTENFQKSCKILWSNVSFHFIIRPPFRQSYNIAPGFALHLELRFVTCNGAEENQAHRCDPYGLQVQEQPLFLVFSSITIFASVGLDL